MWALQKNLLNFLAPNQFSPTFHRPMMQSPLTSIYGLESGQFSIIFTAKCLECLIKLFMRLQPCNFYVGQSHFVAC